MCCALVWESAEFGAGLVYLVSLDVEGWEVGVWEVAVVVGLFFGSLEDGYRAVVVPASGGFGSG